MSLSFDLTDEQRMLRKMVRSFAEKEIAPIAQELDDKEEFSYALTKRMGELGLFGPFVSEEYGGSNVGYVSYIIAVEEIARIDGSQAATLAAGNSLGVSPIYYYGNEEQKKRWLPDLCKGTALASFGLTEPNAGSDAGSSQTRPGSKTDSGSSTALRSLSPTPIQRSARSAWCKPSRERGRKERMRSPVFLCLTERPASRRGPCTGRWSGGLLTQVNSI